MPDSSAFNDRPELPASGFEIYAAATVAEGCPQDFLPAREASPATKAQSAKPRRQTKPKQEPPRFYTQAEVRNMPVSSYRAAGLIPNRGVGQIVGDSGVCKSFTVDALVDRMAEGREFCGRKTKPCACYVFHLEGRAFIPKRLAASAKYRQEMGWPEQSGRVFYWLDPFSLMDKKQIGRAVETIRANGDEGAFIVIDTQAQATPGIDENTNQMTEMLANARGFANAVNGALCLVHHCGKDPSRGGRGHSSQRADFDFQITVEKDGDTIVWRTTKERDEADDQSVRFKLKVYPDIVQDEDGEWQSSCVAVPETELSEDERKALKAVATKTKGAKLAPSIQFALKVFNDAIRESGEAGWLDIDKFREAFLDRYVPPESGDPKKDAQNTRGAYSRALRDLQKKGLVRKVKDKLQNIQPD